MKTWNFFSGPAVLPATVLQQAATAVLDFNNMGLSLLEISHRSKAFETVMNEARQLVRQLLQLTDDYEVLFLTGGASTQFALIPYNLLSHNATAAYLETGQWANNAIKEAALFGKVQVVASSADTLYNHIPKNYSVPTNAAYFHITTNNTVFGTQMHHIPAVSCPIVADMSSDIFSRPLTDLSRYGVIYAGAQKNMGAAGTTLVVVRKDLLGKTGRQIPSMFNYQTHIEHHSMFNTPPVFAVYVAYCTLQWIAEQGLEQLAQKNTQKAQLLYHEIDRNSLFKGSVAIEDRSQMNITFVCTRPELETEFLTFAEQNGCVGLKGYRKVGGYRASIYNAMEQKGVQTLVQLMQEFEQRWA